MAEPRFALRTPSTFKAYAKTFDQKKDQQENPQNYGWTSEQYKNLTKEQKLKMLTSGDKRFIPASGAIEKDVTPEMIAGAFLLPATPLVRGIGKVGNFIVDAMNPLAGGKQLKANLMKGQVRTAERSLAIEAEDELEDVATHSITSDQSQVRRSVGDNADFDIDNQLPPPPETVYLPVDVQTIRGTERINIPERGPDGTMNMSNGQTARRNADGTISYNQRDVPAHLFSDMPPTTVRQYFNNISQADYHSLRSFALNEPFHNNTLIHNWEQANPGMEIPPEVLNTFRMPPPPPRSGLTDIPNPSAAYRDLQNAEPDFIRRFMDETSARDAAERYGLTGDEYMHLRSSMNFVNADWSANMVSRSYVTHPGTLGKIRNTGKELVSDPDRAKIRIAKAIQTGELSPRAMWDRTENILPIDSRSHSLFASPREALRWANKTYAELPAGGQLYDYSLSSDSFPFMLGYGKSKMVKGEVTAKFTGRFNPVNDHGKLTKRYTDLFGSADGSVKVVEDINKEITKFNEVTGKKVPFAKMIDNRAHVPEVVFTKKGGGAKAFIARNTNRIVTPPIVLGSAAGTYTGYKLMDAALAERNAREWVKEQKPPNTTKGFKKMKRNLQPRDGFPIGGEE